MQSNRESKHSYFLRIAALVATRATCPRRSVGCVIINKFGHIKATGYNGVPKNMVHCIDVPCGGEASKSSEGLSTCMATHAEQNALLQCDNVMDIDTMYCTTSPCMHCAKLIANTSCKVLVYTYKYSDFSGTALLESLGIAVIQGEIDERVGN